MSDVDPTPETPVTIGDRLGWWRGDLNARLDALSTQLATQHTELLAAITALRGGASLNQLLTAIQAGGTSGATEATAAAILAAIGALSTYPDGWTVRALLAKLATFVDTEPKSGEPPSGGNSDPYGCEYPYVYEYRCDLVPTGETQSIFGVDYDICAVQFVALSGYMAVGDGGKHAYIAPSRTESIACCLTWDFTGYNAQISNQMRSNFLSLDTFWQITTSYLDAPRTGPTGVLSFILHPEPDNGYTSIYFGVKSGITPPSDVWMHVGNSPAS
jgi:hypothetical protein